MGGTCSLCQLFWLPLCATEIIHWGFSTGPLPLPCNACKSNVYFVLAPSPTPALPPSFVVVTIGIHIIVHPSMQNSIHMMITNNYATEETLLIHFLPHTKQMRLRTATIFNTNTFMQRIKRWATLLRPTTNAQVCTVFPGATQGSATGNEIGLPQRIEKSSFWTSGCSKMKATPKGSS